MKICMVSPYFTPFIKSSEFMLSEALAENGNEVTILTSTGRAPREQKISHNRGKRDFGFNVEYLRCLDIAENPFVPQTLFRALSDYDVILLREDYPVMCLMGYIASRIRGTPTLLTTERNYTPTGVKGRFLKILDVSTGKILRNGVNSFTAHCTAAKKYSMENLGSRKEIVVIPPSIDTNIFKPSPSNGEHLKDKKEENGHSLKLLTVSRLHKHKGLEYLIKAMALLERDDYTGVILHILGKGPDEARLRRLVESLRLEKVNRRGNEIKFLDTNIPNEKMPELYSRCDVYVQPSIVEPFGIAVVEAMACERPIVGTKVGGMLDTVTDGKTGISVEPYNEKELLLAVEQLYDNRSKLKKMGKLARKEAMKYDKNEVVKKYLSIIEEILKR